MPERKTSEQSIKHNMLKLVFEIVSVRVFVHGETKTLSRVDKKTKTKKGTKKVKQKHSC